MTDDAGEDAYSLTSPPLAQRRVIIDDALETVDMLVLETADMREDVDNLQRRAADEQLRSFLAKSEFKGEVFDRFAGYMIRYGTTVCMARLCSGQIFKDCIAIDRPCELPPIDWTHHDRLGLVDETVAIGFGTFREHGLIRGGWTRDGGASIKTYFIGACILAFPNVYRAWLRERRHWELSSTAAAGYLRTQPYDPSDPADIVAIRDKVQRGLQDLDPRTREVVLLSALGYQQCEIAELLDTSVRGVEGLLYRHRARVEAASAKAGDEL